jgi:hypothetical protein
MKEVDGTKRNVVIRGDNEIQFLMLIYIINDMRHEREI